MVATSSVWPTRRLLVGSGEVRRGSGAFLLRLLAPLPFPGMGRVDSEERGQDFPGRISALESIVGLPVVKRFFSANELGIGKTVNQRRWVTWTLTWHIFDGEDLSEKNFVLCVGKASTQACFLRCPYVVDDNNSLLLVKS